MRRWAGTLVAAVLTGCATEFPRVPDLGVRVARWQTEQRHELVRDVARWTQTQPVENESVDRWPTWNELQARVSDDCDGLSLVAYRTLQELGFRDLWRAVIQSREGTLHMVTFWYETSDPWVVDPTGAATRGVVRLSGLWGWRAVEVFNEQEVRPLDPVPPPAPHRSG